MVALPLPLPLELSILTQNQMDQAEHTAVQPLVLAEQAAFRAQAAAKELQGVQVPDLVPPRVPAVANELVLE